MPAGFSINLYDSFYRKIYLCQVPSAYLKRDVAFSLNKDSYASFLYLSACSVCSRAEKGMGPTSCKHAAPAQRGPNMQDEKSPTKSKTA